MRLKRRGQPFGASPCSRLSQQPFSKRAGPSFSAIDMPEINRRGPKRSVRFGAKLRRARDEADLTQDALAEKAELSVTSIRRAERGEPVSVDTSRAIGGALAIPYEILLDATDKPSSSTDPRPNKEIISEEKPYYRYYSDGELVQRLTVNIPAYIEEQFVVYPITFPNEVTNIQPVGSMIVAIKNMNLGNCTLTFIAKTTAWQIDLIISGF
jgi:transcriptional regulator with XRE-family HTH domain